MESLIRAAEVPDLVSHARDLYNSALAGHDDSLAPMSQAEEIQAAFTALRQALIFTATTRGFLDGNVVG